MYKISYKRNMNGEVEVIRNFLKNPQEADELWDSEAIIWIENDEKKEDIIEYFNTKMERKIKIEFFENNKTKTRDLLLDKDGKLMRIFNQEGVGSDSTITYLNSFIKQDYEIRWFMETLCCDVLAFVLLTRREWMTLEDEFGEVYLCHYFEPISLKKKMFDLEREEALIYRKLKEKNESVSYEVLKKLSGLMVEKNRERRKLGDGEISLKKYILESKEKKCEMRNLIREYKIQKLV